MSRLDGDQSAQWAADQVKTWYGKLPTGHQQFAAALHAGKPWAEWTEAEKEANRAHRERGRVACGEDYSSNPLHQARAAKDPDYWNSFSIGQANLFPPKAV